MTPNQSNLIRIQVRTEFLADQSKPAENRYVFAYYIKIKNAGTQAAQLMQRHWIVTDSNGRVQEIKGDGVVGEQPHLKPGRTYQYASGAVLETAVGTMKGFYTLRSDDGEQFQTQIPEFTLSIPRTLH